MGEGVDDDESKHNLQLAEHGHQEVPNAWMLLEKAREAVYIVYLTACY
jgi:hypothetical protein